ncbi:MAG: EAL domain-containing protein [Gammaproteobacteria bacterium]|nr:EAL domain-containing protein [Gammaproteobacteria bacterium]
MTINKIVDKNEFSYNQIETLLDYQIINDLLHKQDLGLIVVDHNYRIYLWNGWLEYYTGKAKADVIGCKMEEVFENICKLRLFQAINNAINSNMSAILSQVFNKHPLPLYENEDDKENDIRIFQQINVKPIKTVTMNLAMIEIKNVTPTIKRENQLREQTNTLSALMSENKTRKESLETILNNSQDAIILIKDNYLIDEYNIVAEQWFSVDKKTINETSLQTYIPDFKLNEKAEGSGIYTISVDNKNTHFDVTWKKIQGQKNNFVIVIRDITKKMEVEKQLFKSEKLAKATLASITDGLISTDEKGIIELVNPIAAELFNVPAKKILNHPIEKLFYIEDEETGKIEDNIVLRAIKNYKIVSSTENAVLKTNIKSVAIPVMATASPIYNSSNKVSGCVLVFRDVKESRQLSNKLSWEATHDALTGLPNRRLFIEMFRKVAESSKGNNENVLLFLDLDRFKLVNDTAGHAVGDELLRQISSLFLDNLRNSDFTARLGGDEFAIILTDCSVKHAAIIANKLCAAVKNYIFPWENTLFTIGASIGLTEIKTDNFTVSEVLENADAACYSAKTAGRNRVHIYGENKEDEKYKKTSSMASKINEALHKENFILYKQAIVTITDSSTELHHYEILLRMQSKNGEIVSAGEFIPVAEQFGQMSSIDQIVIKKLIDYINTAEFQNNKVRFAVNLSGASISDPLFLVFLTKIIEENNIDSNTIHFEITETAAIENFEKAIVLINHFRSKGFKFALDDFGSGMSSFGYLKKLPIDYLKIDGQFVKEICSNKTDFAMVSSINYLGKMMGLKCVAEFVENDQILEKVKEIGIDFAQGYGIDMPSPL